MKKFTMFACVALVLGLAMSSVAGVDTPVLTNSNQAVLHGGAVNLAKAAGDTIQLMGPGGAYQGDFENAACGGDLPADWTSTDVTAPPNHWHLSTTNNDLANLTGTNFWCGANYSSCGTGDPAWGYGNSWNDKLVWRYTVADPNVAVNVDVSGFMFWDNEPGYDYGYLSAEFEGVLGYTDYVTWNGSPTSGGAEAFAATIPYAPGDYIGGTDVVITVRFQSDGGWSDGDCSWPTRGALNMDDVTVQVGTEFTDFNDFESGAGMWTAVAAVGVGDFAKIWCGLEDADPCNTNFSNQVAFIDDGLVVPGVGPSYCINWCYGPSGYIVNTTGGALDPTAHLYDRVESPVMTWPNATYDGCIFAFDVYRHEDLSFDAPGIFYVWGVRSAAPGEDITIGEYLDRNFVYYGGPDYVRAGDNVSDLIVPGRDRVQVSMGVYELGYIWGWSGDDGYPAPYFDNVNVKVYPFSGPAITTREIDLAQDNFPEIGIIDMTQAANLSCRFDMARDIAVNGDPNNDPGDSIVFDITAVRSGSVISGTPVMHWVMNPNHTFDAYRTSVYGTATSGTSVGFPAAIDTVVIADRWAFDLPDTGFLFPGDVLHYYIEASDDVAGDIQTTTAPGDLTGYGDFSHPLAYNSSYTVHMLPTITDDGFGGYTQPGILFWNDFANRGGEAEWYGALDNLGLLAGRDYDIYYTNGPSSGVGNGLGGRVPVTAAPIADYNDMLYTAGDLGLSTIANGDPDFAKSKDVDVLVQWLDLGGKDLYMTGDEVAFDLSQSGSATATFLSDYVGVSISTNDIRPLIDGQTAPAVKALAGNGVIVNQPTWLAYGGCFGINTFDAVTPVATGATSLAEFLAPGCVSGAYSYSAATLNVLPSTSRVISMPYDFMFIYDDPNCGGAKAAAPLTARAQILKDILGYFGVGSNPGDVSGILPGIEEFEAQAAPNPFNPMTKISFNMPQKGHVSIKIYGLRGELVRTLIDDVVDAGQHSVTWNGTSNSGASVSSGVYFYEARYGNEVQVNKITMVK